MGNTTHISRDNQNKGVNVTSEQFTTLAQASEEQHPCHDTSEPITVRQVREQLHSIIELMGPNTPHFTQNSASDAENDESIIESSVVSSIYKVKQITKSDCLGRHVMDATISSANSPRENSDLSAVLTTETQCESVCFHENAQRQETCCHCSYFPHCTKSPSMYIPTVPSCMCGGYGNYHVQHMKFENECIPVSEEREKRTASGFMSKCLGSSKKEKKRRMFYVDMPNNSGNYALKGNCISATNKATNKKNIFKLPSQNKKDSGYFSEPVLGKNAKNCKFEKSNAGVNTEGTTRIDVYYFDHGNASYFRTTDVRPIMSTDVIAEATDDYTNKFWAGFFGTVHIGFAFCTSFVLQFFRFILCSLLRPLVIGILQLLSDYGLKPMLTVLFNAILQPPLIFVYNMAISCRDVCEPVAETTGFFVRNIAVLLGAIRLIDVRIQSRELRDDAETNCSYNNDQSVKKEIEEAQTNKTEDKRNDK